MKICLAFALLCCLAGCSNLEFTALSVAPPGKVADLDDEDRKVEISSGIALAIECTAIGSSDSGRCENMRVSSENASQVKVYRAYVDELTAEYAYGTGGKRATVFVVVGMVPGKTRVHVKADQADAKLDVTVVPD